MIKNNARRWFNAVSCVPLTLNYKPTSLFIFPFSLLGFSPKAKREQKGRRIDVTPVALHWAYNPVQTVWCTRYLFG